jgi:hypothetical protein
MKAERKPQISPLRCAPVEMTILLEDRIRRFQEKSAELPIPRLRSGGQREGQRLPFPCHPDRSEAERRDLRFRGPFLEMFFDRVVMGLRPTQGDEKRLQPEAALHGSATLPFVISTGAQRSGETSVLRPLPGNVFRQSVPAFPAMRRWTRAHEVRQRHQHPQESRSVAERRDLRFPFELPQTPVAADVVG